MCVRGGSKMKINYGQFHLMFGNRTVERLANPRIFNLSKLNLPKQNVYHYLPSIDADIAPNENNPLFADVSQRIPLYSYMDLATRAGSLNIRAYNQHHAIKQHVKQNRKLMAVFDLKTIKPNPLIPVIYNYGLADKRYKYLGDVNRIPYYKSFNMLNTLIKGMVDCYNSHGEFYNQFIFINVPELNDIPKVSAMKNGCMVVDLKFFKAFNTFEKQFIFEMWKFLGMRREKSLFKNIPKKLLDKINIVFTSNNVFTYYNLGKLDEWRKTEENPTGKIDPIMMSKNFMKMLIQLDIASKNKEMVELTDEEKIELEKQSEDTKGTDDEVFSTKKKDSETKKDDLEENQGTESDSDESQEDTEEVLEDKLNTNESGNEINVSFKAENDIVSEIIDEEDTVSKDEKPDESINELTKSKVVNLPEEQEEEFDEVISAKLDVSDVLSLKNIPIEETPVLVTRPHQAKTPDEKARIVLDEIARNQNMTVSKFDSLRKSLGKYKDITLTKDSNKTIAELIDIKPEDVAITEEEREVSSLQVMDKKYITQVMERDIASMLVGIQGAGVLVQDIKKSEHENIAGGYDVYSMKIKPIEGESSTIRVRIPKIQPNGKFKVNSIDYFFKKQRRD